MNLNPHQHAARKRGRPRKTSEPVVPERKVINASSLLRVRAAVENLAHLHRQAVSILSGMCQHLTPEELFDRAETLIRAVDGACSQRSIIRRFADSIDVPNFYPSEASYREARTAITRLKHVTEYMESPIPNGGTISNPGIVALDALETIARFTNT